MMHLNPLVLVGAVIGVITALLVAAYAAVKDKKNAMGFERNMEDGEIMRRLARYARPYLSKFLIVGLLMLFSIAYDIISPLIVGRIEELVAGEFELRALFLGVSVYAGVLGENREQEMTKKLAEHAYDGAPLHFIGHLQRNKVKNVVGKVAMIESVGSLELLSAIDKQSLRAEIEEKL